MNNCSMAPNVEYKVKKLLGEQLDVPFVKIGLEDRIEGKDLGADSLDIIEIAMALETEFKMEVREKDMDELFTVSDIIKYIERRQA